MDLTCHSWHLRLGADQSQLPHPLQSSQQNIDSEAGETISGRFVDGGRRGAWRIPRLFSLQGVPAFFRLAVCGSNPHGLGTRSTVVNDRQRFLHGRPDQVGGWGRGATVAGGVRGDWEMGEIGKTIDKSGGPGCVSAQNSRGGDACRPNTLRVARRPQRQ
ncbi:hypothetical protein C0Q70_02612 [Pomacea canaliculata]|uniref:Uncharacterized protein n=1 Tax=Pomacea canaliculata TaxID=400727 RepID=A0A2T7PQE9_POMCA|nr:hypothetical protein C0Q70_02612 [Pomacea canaliculata]